MERISGMSFDFYMMGFPIHVESVNLSISDNSAVALTRGHQWTSRALRWGQR